MIEVWSISTLQTETRKLKEIFCMILLKTLFVAVAAKVACSLPQNT